LKVIVRGLPEKSIEYVSEPKNVVDPSKLAENVCAVPPTIVLGLQKFTESVKEPGGGFPLNPPEFKLKVPRSMSRFPFAFVFVTLDVETPVKVSPGWEALSDQDPLVLH